MFFFVPNWVLSSYHLNNIFKDGKLNKIQYVPFWNILKMMVKATKTECEYKGARKGVRKGARGGKFTTLSSKAMNNTEIYFKELEELKITIVNQLKN